VTKFYSLKAGMHCMPCIHWRYAPDLHAYVHFTFKSPSNECWRL